MAAVGEERCDKEVWSSDVESFGGNCHTWLFIHGPMGRDDFSRTQYAEEALLRDMIKSKRIEARHLSLDDYYEEIKELYPQRRKLTKITSRSDMATTIDRWHGNSQQSDGSDYQGDHINHMRHGNGVWTSPTGERYEGQWVSDKRCGHGTNTWGDGTCYRGQYVRNKRHGEGKYTFPSRGGEPGLTYTGQFLDDMLNHVICEYPNGDRYKGQFANNVRHGVGTYTWRNGTCYEGQYSNDVRHGRGILTYPENLGGSVQEVNWVMGILDC